ncbi:MAG TPA: DNA mismatch repair endonuclease MutL [Candidatus Dormibacteraeota bacterium]
MTIRLLPPDVANAIAAGEVVERPASVVKELIENALDAGARRISVDVHGAGRTLIRVADDGAGMSAGELPLAFLRHATSKLAAREDLDAIGTLGFRGEALASIAAVSDVECRSGAARLRVRGGQVVEEGPAAPAPGTVVEVRDLFASTPARLKFMKSDAVEGAACLQVASSYALLFPAVRFTVAIGERRSFSTPGDGDAAAAAAAVLGASVGRELIGVAADGEVAVSGLVSQPRVHRSSREAILLAVNHRPVSSRALTFALEECYRGRLERGRHPIAVLDVAVPLEDVDVNVHPAKREVKFKSEGAVFSALQRAVRAALQETRPYEIRLDSRDPEPWPRAPAGHDAPALLLDAVTAVEVASSAPLRPLGQAGDGYLVAESPEGVLLIDQHAAHERVLYNRFLARLRGAQGLSQPLLVPAVVDLEPAQVAVMREHDASLRSAGFVVEEFGSRQARVEAAPAETPAGRAGEALSATLAALAEGRGDGAVEAAAASLACHSAVRFGDPLDLSEQRRLLQELEAAPESVTCPHGRPTRLLLAWPDLKRHFRRNY